MSYTPTIGLEIHAELLTESKLFCGCANRPNDDEPNTHICPVCVGYPGALPFLNKRAVEHILRVGTALRGTLATRTEFDRKHYFYPDIPKGYQISQYPYPLVSGAELLGVRIERIHLEEDTAKSSHDHAHGSLIDFNRSGVPLMELVTEPVMHTADDAREFGEMLQLTLRYLEVARARMEWGEMRVEANISVSKTDTLGTKVEVKNLNSFKAVAGAIDYEVKRQTEVLESGGEVAQETRGWNENSGKTFSQRLKETSAEYRYMPDPDLPRYDIGAVNEWSAERLKHTMPELPTAKKERYTTTLGIPEKQALVLMKQRELGVVFDAVAETFSAGSESYGSSVKTAANYLTSDVMQYVEEDSTDLFKNITADGIVEIVRMLQSGEISSRGAKDIIAVIANEGGSPKDIAERENLFQQSDEGALSAVIKAVVREHKTVADEYRAGKEPALQFLVGQVMKATKGSANPAKAAELLKQHLAQQM